MFARRFFHTSLRHLNAANPSGSKLARLTLYTGGPECSLCEIAKQDLEVIRYTHPFDLETYNIHNPPADADPAVAEEIRERYKYDIPILHLDTHYLQKHRVNSTVLKQTLEKYDPTDPHPWYQDNVFRKDARPIPGGGKKKRPKRNKPKPVEASSTKSGGDQ